MDGPPTLRGEPRTIQTPHLRLAAKQWGRADGMPVLALHGWLDNANSFDRLAPLLPDVSLWALDLPGHGLSAHRPVGSLYGFLDLVAEVVAAVDAMPWTAFALLGHSLGGGIAPFIAAIRPAQVRRLVLLDALGPLSDSAEAAPERFARSLRFERQRSGRPRYFANPTEAAQRIADVAAPLRLDSAQLLVERGLIHEAAGYRWRSDPALRVPSRQRLTEPQVQAFLRRVECPTLLVHTTSGFTDARAQLPDRIDCVPNITAHVVPGGHHVHLDDAPRVADLVRPFLAENPPSSEPEPAPLA
ncbi:MAG: alpha/beta hydrolase [Myxococcales bacterium FL481]|nr:MAG: alpha/beta hydrolase [Myxococcales bacterium FL481]